MRCWDPIIFGFWDFYFWTPRVWISHITVKALISELAPIAECKQTWLCKITFATHARIQRRDIEMEWWFDMFPNHVCLHLAIEETPGIWDLMVSFNNIVMWHYLKLETICEGLLKQHKPKMFLKLNLLLEMDKKEHWSAIKE